MHLERLLAELPDEATVPVGWLRRRLAAVPSSDRLVDLTVQEAAEELGRAPSTLRTWCAEGQLRGAYKLHGREWRIPAAALRSLGDPDVDDDELPEGPIDLGRWREEAAES